MFCILEKQHNQGSGEMIILQIQETYGFFNYLTSFVSYMIVLMRGRHKCMHSISLNHCFISLGFHGKVFNEADYHTQKRYCTLFPSLEFFFHSAFL